MVVFYLVGDLAQEGSATNTNGPILCTLFIKMQILVNAIYGLSKKKYSGTILNIILECLNWFQILNFENPGINFVVKTV